MKIDAHLEAGLEVLRARPKGLILPKGAQPKLLELVGLLDKWNRTYNLTAIRDADRMISHHILDSLALTALIGKAGAVLDVGTGAGLPGLPVALARPDCRVTLIDANSKKTAFCEQARIALGLTNVEVVTGRVEDFHPITQYRYVVSRAFSDLANFVTCAAQHLALGGKMLAMKGNAPRAEIQILPNNWSAQVVPLDVPGVVGERCVVVLTREIKSEARD